MISFDMRTVIAVCILINIMSLAIITSLWLQNRKHFAGIFFWVVDHALQLLATLLIILRGKIPDFASMVLSNTMVITGLLFLYIGFQHFIEKKVSQIHNYILLAIFIFIHSYYTVIQPNLDARTINTSVMMTILSIQCIWLLIRKTNPDMRRVTRGTYIAMACIGFISLIRAFMIIFYPQSSNDFFDIPVFDTLTLVILYIISFVYLPFNLMMMVSGRLVIIANRNEDRYRQLFELESDAIVLVDKESGHILDANQAMEKMYGYSHGEILTLNRLDISAEPELTKKSIEQDLQYIPVRYHKKKDGTIFPVELMISNIEFHGKMAQIDAIRDITLRMQAEEQYRQIVETANEGICLMDKDFKIAFVNQKVIDMLGYSMEEMIGSLVSDFMYQDDLQDHQNQETLRKQGEGAIYERRLRCKDGSEIVASVSSKPIFDGLGKFRGSFAMFTDITDRKKAEAALHNQYAILKSIIDSPKTPVFSVDSNYCYTSFNTSHAETMKLIYGDDIQIGKNILDYMSVEEDRRIAKENFDRVLNGEHFAAESYSGEDSLSRLYFEVSHNPVRNSEGKIIGISIFARDITERKMTEEALRNSEEKYRNLFDNALVGIYKSKLDGSGFLDINRELIEILGYSEDELLTMSSIDLWANPDDRKVIMQQLQENGVLLGFEVDIVTKSREIKNGLASMMLYTKQGYIEGTVIDITDRKKAEEVLKQSERELYIKNKIAYIFLTFPDDEMYGEILRFILETMESEYGVFGYLSENGDLVCPSMIGNVMEQCNITDKDIIFPHETWGNGIWVRALREKKSLYSNEPFNLPEGHLQIVRNISTPIIYQGNVIGLLEVANKSADYDEKDIKMIESIVDQISPILSVRLEMDKANAESLKRFELDRVRASIYAMGDNINLKEIIGSLSDSLREVGIDYANCSVHLLDDEEQGIAVRWGRKTYPKIDSYTFVENKREGLMAEESPNINNIYEIWRKQQICYRRDLFAEDPYNERELMKDNYKEDIRCILDVPFLYGTIAINSLKPNAFSQRDIELLKAFANIISEANLRYRDISQRNQAEELLKQRVKELALSNVELEQFAYISSHDLQEPLRKIQAFGEQLKTKYSTVLDERGRDYIQRMQNAAERMQTLINDLLKYSRIATKAQPYVSVNLTEVLNDVVADLEIRIKQAGGHVEIGDMPVIDAEQAQMYQLFQNLINNGLKFHQPKEPPVVKVYSEIHGGICHIFVEDNGIGFDEQYLDRIFVIFQRLHARFEFEGTGIGLAICRKIVEHHNGNITAKSKPNEGSTFIITLPVKQDKVKQ